MPDHPVPSTRFSVSATGTTGTAPSSPGTRTAVDHVPEQLGRGQRAGGVVDHDHLGLLGDGGQPGAHRGGPGGAAGHDGRRPEGLVTVGTGGRHRPAGADRAVVGDHEHDAVDDLARGTHRPGRDRATGQGEELLGAAEPATRSPGHHDGPDGPRSAQGSASLRRTSAVSSSTPRAKVSSDTRIWRARLSMRFSPADRPLSLSRIERFRTTSATW